MLIHLEVGKPMLIRTLVIALVASAILNHSASGQIPNSASVRIGDQLRIHKDVRGPWIYGILSGVHGDTIVLRECATCVQNGFAISQISQIELSRSFHSNVAPAGALGALLGIIASAATGATHSHGPGPGNSHVDVTPAYIIGGAVLGGVIGLAWRTRVWQPATIPRPGA